MSFSECLREEDGEPLLLALLVDAESVFVVDVRRRESVELDIQLHCHLAAHISLFILVFHSFIY